MHIYIHILYIIIIITAHTKVFPLASAHFNYIHSLPTYLAKSLLHNYKKMLFSFQVSLVTGQINKE